MRRALFTAAAVTLAVAALVALTATSGPSRVRQTADRSKAVSVPLRAPDDTVVCEAIGCPSGTTTTTTAPAPTTTTSPYPAVPDPAHECTGPDTCVPVTWGPPPTTAAPAPPPTDATPQSGTQSVSQAWLDQLAQCESGGVNGPRTGYFGIEAPGVAVGSLSYADQVAWVERILAQTGVTAWGSYPSCVGAPY